MVQDMPTPIISSMDPSKTPVYVNGNMATTHHPQLAIPVAVPMPLFPHHHQHHHFYHPPPQPPPPSSNGLPPSQYTTPPPPPPDHQASAQSYCEYLYRFGFMQGHFSDITVSFSSVQKSYALHRLILARSPMIYRRLMTDTRAQHEKILELDIAASFETIHTIIGHLYRPLGYQDLHFIVNENPHLAAELLDAAQEFELDMLSHHLLHLVQYCMNQNTVFFWMDAILSRQHQTWIDRVDHYIVHYLTVLLPHQLGSFSSSSPSHETSNDTSSSSSLRFGDCTPVLSSKQPLDDKATSSTMDLAQLYADLPVKYLKRCLEHEELAVGSSSTTTLIQRYHFALQVLQYREQKGKRELSVLMQFQREGQEPSILLVKKQALKLGRWQLPQDDHDDTSDSASC